MLHSFPFISAPFGQSCVPFPSAIQLRSTSSLFPFPFHTHYWSHPPRVQVPRFIYTLHHSYCRKQQLPKLVLDYTSTVYLPNYNSYGLQYCLIILTTSLGEQKKLLASTHLWCETDHAHRTNSKIGCFKSPSSLHISGKMDSCDIKCWTCFIKELNA